MKLAEFRSTLESMDITKDIWGQLHTHHMINVEGENKEKVFNQKIFDVTFDPLVNTITIQVNYKAGVPPISAKDLLDRIQLLTSDETANITVLSHIYAENHNPLIAMLMQQAGRTESVSELVITNIRPSHRSGKKIVIDLDSPGNASAEISEESQCDDSNDGLGII